MGSPDATGFGAAMRDHLAEVERRNAAVLDGVADLLHDTVAADGVVYTAGSGHSIALVLETFYRAGGLACVHPVFHPALVPLEGGGASTLLERVEGLAAEVLASAAPSSRDLAVVFSNSGVNAFPVELARGFRQAGCPVVAVTSLPHLRSAPVRAGAKLDDIADHLIDTGVPPGDAAYPAPGAATAALSSLASIYCWNLLLVRLAERAGASGLELPLWSSANVEGGDEGNAALAARYRGRIPHL